MDDRKRTKAQEKSYADLIQEVHEQEMWFDQWQSQRNMIPREWRDMERIAPVSEKKTQLTLRLDTDMVRWYRALGSGYQARMNAILRTFMLARLSKLIEEKGDRDWKGGPI